MAILGTIPVRKASSVPAPGRGNRKCSLSWRAEPVSDYATPKDLKICPLSALQDQYELVKDSDKIVTS